MKFLNWETVLLFSAMELHKERYLFKYNDGRFAGEEKAAQKEKSKGTKESAGGG